MTNSDAWQRLNGVMSGASILEDDWARVAPPAGVNLPYMDWVYPFSQAAIEAGNAPPYAVTSGKLADMVLSGEGDIERFKSILDTPAAALVTSNVESGANRAGVSRPLTDKATAWWAGLWSAIPGGSDSPWKGYLVTGALIIGIGLALSAFASAFGSRMGSKAG